MRKGRWLSLAVVFLLVCSVFVMGITNVEVSGEENTEDRDEIEYREDDVENEEIQEIEDWYDLDDVRDDLEANYTLMNDLDEDSDGYDELASEDANELNDRGKWEENESYEANDIV